jgi:rSAM/selenodomain-associated transferase 1
MNNRLIVMARPPLAGQVKTRIGRELGDDMALEVYTRLLSNTMSVVKRSGFPVEIFVTEEHSYFSESGFSQRLQQGNDLGERMHHAFRSTFFNPVHSVVMIGTDCPGIDAAHIQTAFDLLRRVDVVFGPAMDGGYYLIGMNAIHAELFSNMPWSTSELLEKTILKSRSLNLSFATMTSLTDVDLPQDIPESWGLNTNIAKSS